MIRGKQKAVPYAMFASLSYATRAHDDGDLCRAVPLEIRAERKYREISSWPVTHAVVQSASVSITNFSWSPKKIRDCPDMEYSYSIAGRTYTTRNQIFDFNCWPDANDFVAKYGPGAQFPSHTTQSIQTQQ